MRPRGVPISDAGAPADHHSWASARCFAAGYCHTTAKVVRRLGLLIPASERDKEHPNRRPNSDVQSDALTMAEILLWRRGHAFRSRKTLSGAYGSHAVPRP